MALFRQGTWIWIVSGSVYQLETGASNAVMLSGIEKVKAAVVPVMEQLTICHRYRSC
eukprot:COSAG02_NODE_193_length_29843_cov_30.519903_25_plen_57_part_00